MVRKRKPGGKDILIPLKSESVAKVFERLGYELTSTHGSHRVYNHQGKTLNITIPFHRKELQKPLLKKLIRTAGITVEEFMTILKNL